MEGGGLPYLVKRRAPDQAAPLLEYGNSEVREDHRSKYPEHPSVRHPCVVIVFEEGGLDQFQGEDGQAPCQQIYRARGRT